MSTNRLQPINVFDFTGGVNLRDDEVQLAENEVADVLNMDFDPLGGVVTRRGWLRWNQMPIDGAFSPGDLDYVPWNPRNAFNFELSSGQNIVVVALGRENGRPELWYSSNGEFSHLDHDGLDVAMPWYVADLRPHRADFAQWGDALYITRGRHQPLRWVGAGNATTLLDLWTNNILQPVGGRMPSANLIASHTGYMFAADTIENGISYPNRLRWSHPNRPEDWRQDDYIDIDEDGSRITAIVPLRDHLLIFKTSSVWALYGYDENTWQLVNVSYDLGAPHRNAVVRAEDNVFFVSWPQGVHVYNGESVTELSTNLRPLFRSPDFNANATDNMWLGWVNKRLWWSVPWRPGGPPPTDANTIFVFDPAVGMGAWTIYRGATGCGLGPFVQSSYGGLSKLTGLAFCRATRNAFMVDALDSGADGGAGLFNVVPEDEDPDPGEVEVLEAAIQILNSETTRAGTFQRTEALQVGTIFGVASDGTPFSLSGIVNYPFATRLRTRWYDGGWPTVAKRWRRPEVIARDRDRDYTLYLTSYHDFQGGFPRRTRETFLERNQSGELWNGFDWNDGTYWGRGVRASRMGKMASFGAARSIQFEIEGEPGVPWGFDGLILKFVSRRFR